MDVPFAVGDTIAGRYRIERVLGRGGMGVVVAARHVHLGEAVAIKIPFARALMGRDLAARVLREGRAAARLRGEHVARVMDVGTLDSGEPFIVFELLRGGDFETALDARGTLPIDEALEYVLQACEGLAEAHALGIVHRDLKPANLFLTKRPDGSPAIKIIDFGIAKAADPAAAGAAATESFMIFGTPLYMSPEQMRSSRDVDARADIWSLGAVLHHLLSGAPPFPPKSLPEIYQLTQAGPPKIRTLRQGIPEAIEAALLRCMAQNPADRFADVGELAQALAPHAPARAAVCAERARRILAAAHAETDLTLPAEASAIDRDAATGDANAVPTRVVSDPANAAARDSVVSAPTLAAGVPPPAKTIDDEVAARTSLQEPAHETIGAVRIDVTTGDATPRRKRSPIVLAIGAVVACSAAAIVTWIATGPHDAPGPPRAGSSSSAAITTPEPDRSPGARPVTPPAVVSLSAAVVTPASAVPPSDTGAPPAVTTASATTTTTATTTATSSARPPTSAKASGAPPIRTATPRAGPLDDPN